MTTKDWPSFKRQVSSIKYKFQVSILLLPLLQRFRDLLDDFLGESSRAFRLEVDVLGELDLVQLRQAEGVQVIDSDIVLLHDLQRGRIINAGGCCFALGIGCARGDRGRCCKNKLGACCL